MEIIPGFTVVKTIGQGEFGRVYEVIDQKNRHVAIKIVDSDAPDQKLKREIGALKLETSTALVLQLAENGELFEYILKHKYLSDTESRRIFSQIVSAISYMHSKGIVHRDLKLENILLDKNANVLVTDFGFVNKAKELLRTSCGSPCYAAPELVICNSYNGVKADSWSCGIILYSMACGYLPYDDDPINPDGENINLLYTYIVNTTLEYPNFVSKDCVNLMKKLIVVDFEKRITVTESMAHKWFDSVRHVFEDEPRTSISKLNSVMQAIESEKLESSGSKSLSEVSFEDSLEIGLNEIEEGVSAVTNESSTRTAVHPVINPRISEHDHFKKLIDAVDTAPNSAPVEYSSSGLAKLIIPMRAKSINRRSLPTSLKHSFRKDANLSSKLVPKAKDSRDSFGISRLRNAPASFPKVVVTKSSTDLDNSKILPGIPAKPKLSSELKTDLQQPVNTLEDSSNTFPIEEASRESLKTFLTKQKPELSQPKSDRSLTLWITNLSKSSIFKNSRSYTNIKSRSNSTSTTKQLKPRVRYHSPGLLLDKRALTQRDPDEVIEYVKSEFINRGFIVDRFLYSLKIHSQQLKRVGIIGRLKGYMANILEAKRGYITNDIEPLKKSVNVKDQQIHFIIEIMKVRSVPGMYVLEFKKIFGDVCSFRSVYESFIVDFK